MTALTKNQVYLIANGDLRETANRQCWAEQEKMEATLAAALKREGKELVRGHPVDSERGHGFINSQKMGISVFRTLDPDAPLIVAESVWQYSQHILPGLSTHRGPILTVANWSGAWPGLVGMLNLNGSLTKMGVCYSTLWSEKFEDDFFLDGLRAWLRDGVVKHDQSHVQDFSTIKIDHEENAVAWEVADALRAQKAIMGVFDEGCMGMHNAILPDELLNPTGVFKERLSQSALYAAVQEVTDSEADAAFDWLTDRGMRFDFGEDEATELTREQTRLQLKMYIAAVRIADEFGCDTIGIQYQQGLKDLLPASDLAEGLLNNTERPPVTRAGADTVLFDGEPLPHFNEVDEGAGLDGLVTHRLWSKLGWPSDNTLHDLRWGENYSVNGTEQFVWVFLISGAAPASHFSGGYAAASSERQPPMYFRLGGGTVKGISKPGWVVWSRIFVMDGVLCCDLGLAEVVALPQEETDRRWRETTPQWPIMSAIVPGVSRDQMMARHKSNHIQVVYAPDHAQAARGCRIKAAAMERLGLRVALCGDVPTSG